jgi:hypothetical protein
VSSGWGHEAGALLFSAAVLAALLFWICQPQEQRWSPEGRVGRLVSGWRWRGRPPAMFTMLKKTLGLYVLTACAGLWTIRLWAARAAAPEHATPFRTQDGALYYIPGWAGRVVDAAVPVGAALLVLLLFAVWRSRDQLERYDRGGRTSG